MHKIDTDYKVGSPTARSWAGIYGYRPENLLEDEEAGMLLATISMGSEIDFDLANIAALLQDELQDKYYSAAKTAPSNIAALETALKAMRTRLEDILHREPELAKTGIDLEIAVVVIKDNLLCAAVVGESKIYVRRGDEMHEISNALIDPDLSGYMFTGSLQLQEDDRVLLSTHKVPQHNSLKALEEQMGGFSIQNLAVKGGAALLAGYELNWEEIEAVELAVREAEEAEQMAIQRRQEIIDAQQKQAALLEGKEEETEIYTPETQIIPVTPDQAEVEPQDLEIEVTTAEIEREDRETRFSDHEKSVPPKEKVEKRDYIGEARERLAPALLATRETAGNLFQTVKEKSFELRTQLQESGILETLAKNIKEFLQKAKEVAQGVYQNLANGQPGDRYSRRIPVRGGRGGGGLIGRIQGVIAGNGGNQRSRYLIAAAAILVVVIGVGINRSLEARRIQTEIDQLTEQTESLESQFVEIRANATAAALSNDPNRRGEVLGALDDLRGDLDSLQANELITEDLQARLSDIMAETSTAEDQALKIRSFTQPALITDLATEFQDVEASGVASSGSQIFVTDKGRDVVYSLTNNLGSQVEILNDDLVEPYLIQTTPDGNLVVFDRNEESVIANINADSGELTRQIGLSPESQGEVTTMDVWSNGFLYAISPERQALVRQPDVSGSFQIPDYNNPWRRDPDFGRAVDMVVDYWIYVIIDGQGLKRYLSGEPSPVTIQGLLPEDKAALTNATAVAATERRIYVADPNNRRIISFVKDLNDENLILYEGQYKYRGDSNVFAEISDIVVTDSENQIIVLDGNRVIRLDVATF